MSLEKLPDDLPVEIEKAIYRERLKAFLLSRDAGSKLTFGSLGAGIHLSSVINAAIEITRYADEILKIVKNSGNVLSR
jgi:hypothetical protein